MTATQLNVQLSVETATASRVNVVAKIAIDRQVRGDAFGNAAGQVPKKANVNVDVQISVKDDGSASTDEDEDTARARDDQPTSAHSTYVNDSVPEDDADSIADIVVSDQEQDEPTAGDSQSESRFLTNIPRDARAMMRISGYAAQSGRAQHRAHTEDEVMRAASWVTAAVHDVSAFGTTVHGDHDATVEKFSKEVGFIEKETRMDDPMFDASSPVNPM